MSSGIHAAESVPPLPAIGIALAAGVTVATGSEPPYWWLAAWADGANVDGTPESDAHVVLRGRLDLDAAADDARIADSDVT